MSCENSDDKCRKSVWNYVLSHRMGVYAWVNHTGCLSLSLALLIWYKKQTNKKMKAKLRSHKLRENLKW